MHETREIQGKDLIDRLIKEPIMPLWHNVGIDLALSNTGYTSMLVCDVPDMNKVSEDLRSVFKPIEGTLSLDLDEFASFNNVYVVPMVMGNVISKGEKGESVRDLITRTYLTSKRIYNAVMDSAAYIANIVFQHRGIYLPINWNIENMYFRPGMAYTGIVLARLQGMLLSLIYDKEHQFRFATRLNLVLPGHARKAVIPIKGKGKKIVEKWFDDSWRAYFEALGITKKIDGNVKDALVLAMYGINQQTFAVLIPDHLKQRF